MKYKILASNSAKVQYADSAAEAAEKAQQIVKSAKEAVSVKIIPE